MPKNKKYIDDVLKELKKEYKPFYTSSLYEVAETTATASIKKQQMWNKLFQERENKFFEMLELVKQKLQQVEEHETENGYCCACEYDIACMNEKIEIAVQRKVEEIKKSKTKIVGILFNAQNSPIEYSLQEIADKIIKIIKN